MLSVLFLLGSCGNRDVPELDVYGQAGGCYRLADGKAWLAGSNKGYGFTADTAEKADRFFFQASDLGTYLLYDADRGYVVADGKRVVRQTSLESDTTLVDDSYISGAEWILETSPRGKERYQLRSRRTDTWLADEGLTDDDKQAAALTLEPAEGCTAHPELAVDATGEVTKTTFEDGDLYGIVDAHEHLLTNFGFGGGLFHGSPYHRLGVEHAMGDCGTYHGEMGRRDFFGYVFDGGNDGGQLGDVIPDMVRGELSTDNHHTDGYPTFTDWPDAGRSSTHQTQYYRWLERAYLGGLRLLVQHATSNAVICKMSVGIGASPARYDCEDMTAVDREIDEVYALERYIDAQSGGPGEGWFRVVTSPAEAREVIRDGKLAVVLGIETSDLFGCTLTPRPGAPVCDEAYITEQLDRYEARGIRVLFPVHKYDNAFTPGDGSNDFIEAGNFLNSGHWTNLTEDCPADVHGRDDGKITFGGLQQPREDYLSPAPVDFGHLEDDPLEQVLPYVGKLLEPSIEGDWCQNGSLTPLGEFLILQMMQRGMVLELDHLPQWSYDRAFEMMAEHDYPAVGTHGHDHDGKLYETGGLSVRAWGTCHDPNVKGSMWRGRQDRLALMAEYGMYPGLGLGFDFNGFAGAPRGRFEEGRCSEPQTDPTTYPFTSWAGDVTFTEPVAGERVFDFDTEGMAHIGLLPELIEDARKDAASDADLEALFRSAEGYLRMWEKAETRGAAMRGE